MALPEEYPAMPAEVPGNVPVRVGPGRGVQWARLAHHQEAGQEEEGCDQHPLSSLSVMGECRVTAGQKTFFDQKSNPVCKGKGFSFENFGLKIY